LTWLEAWEQTWQKLLGILDIENRNNQVNQEQTPDAQMVFVLIRVQN
jgi:uncharacterized protein YbcC (UPF0753/DUF2309 family)